MGASGIASDPIPERPRAGQPPLEARFLRLVRSGRREEAARLVHAELGALALEVYLYALVTRWIQDGKLRRYFDEVAFPRLPSDREA